MRKEKWRFGTGFLLIFLIIACSVSPQFRHIYALPSQMRVMQGDAALFAVQYPLTVEVSANRDYSVILKEAESGDFFSQPVFVESVKSGQATVEFKLLGFIPFKEVQVDILPPLKMIAGGQSIGVVMHSDGVLVVGSSSVVNQEGMEINPAQQAGIRTGDVILAINGQRVRKDIDVAELIDLHGKEGVALEVLLRREQEEFTVKLRPVLCKETNRFRIGLFVRDSAVGVGTLTFFDPTTATYGALGHVITDGDTNQAIACRDGKIVSASVAEIHLGKAGQPGEKVGSFPEEEAALGNIEKNTRFGIYGKINASQRGVFQTELLEVASMNQIEEGPAEILTVVDGQKVERFAIEIERVHMQDYPESKGMVIKVTDERLLAKTGGIIQGMSGSPIVQKGRLVGAVTHVFVHDPTKGYACFMDWMLMEGGLIEPKRASSMPQLFTRTAAFG